MDDDEDEDQGLALEIAGDPTLDADFLEVLTRLRRVLGDARGKLHVASVQALAGFDRPTHYRARLVGRAMRHLGWERWRSRFDGGIKYVYARGTRLQREIILDVVRGDDGELVVRRREP